MEFIVSAKTDVGLVKKTNQDGLSVKILNTPLGRMAFAVMCDGMGGLSMGEIASTTVISAFNDWVANDLVQLCRSGNIDDNTIRTQWQSIITEQNRIIRAYGSSQGKRMGTTVVVMLITQSRYYVMNVGDSRAYEISDTFYQITEDQTFVAQEVKYGRMTPEQAAKDPRQNVLLQCVGASDSVHPDMFYGYAKQGAVYMLCSDGFRHTVTPDEIYQRLHPYYLCDASQMEANAHYLIELAKFRSEQDNISVLMIRTY